MEECTLLCSLRGTKRVLYQTCRYYSQLLNKSHADERALPQPASPKEGGPCQSIWMGRAICPRHMNGHPGQCSLPEPPAQVVWPPDPGDPRCVSEVELVSEDPEMARRFPKELYIINAASILQNIYMQGGLWPQRVKKWLLANP